MMYPLFADFSLWLASGAAVVAVGLPLVVHLLYRQRYQIVPWAAMRFLLVAERRQKRRIDQWLLLILRTLALLLFLFAMTATSEWAERVWQWIKPGASETIANVPRTHHVLVIDGSLSMTAKTDDGTTRFELAISQAENLIRSSNAGDGFTVLLMSSTAQPVVPGPSNDPEKVIAELKKLKPTHGSADPMAALAAAAEMLKRPSSAYPRRQLTVFTDLQRATWANAIPRPENNNAENWQQLTSRADVALVDTARADTENIAIAEIALSNPMPLVDQPVSVTVTLVNLGRVEKKNVYLDLLIGRPSGGSDSLAAVEQKLLEPLPPGIRVSVRFDLAGANTFRERGVHVVQAKLLQPDALVADDARALAVEVRDGIHAILVDGNYVPEANRRAATHLNRALFPPGAKPTDTPNRPRLVTPKEFLDPTLCDLTGVDCVFFCDVPNPTPDMAAKLDAVLRRGGTVVIGLGPKAAESRDLYNEVLYHDGTGVLPGPLGGMVTVNSPDELGFRLAADDKEFGKPPLQPFDGDKARAGLISVPFRTYMKLDSPPEGRARRILTFARATPPSFVPTECGFGFIWRELLAPRVESPAPEPKAKSNEKPDPALVEWNRHRGRVYVFTSTFNEDWNDWPSLLSYLPFWHEFVKYSVANPDRHTLRVGEPVEEFFPANSAGLTAGLNGPDVNTNIPLVMQDEAGVARFTDTTVSGLYRMGLNGSRDRVFAVNVAEVVPGAPTESDLRRVDAKEFQAGGSVQVVPDPVDVKPTSQNGSAIEIKSLPKPHGPLLARIATILAILVLATELLVAWLVGPSCSGATGAVTPARKGLFSGLTLPKLLLGVVGFPFVQLVLLAAFTFFDDGRGPIGAGAKVGVLIVSLAGLLFLRHARASRWGSSIVAGVGGGTIAAIGSLLFTLFAHTDSNSYAAVWQLPVLLLFVVCAVFWGESLTTLLNGWALIAGPLALAVTACLLAIVLHAEATDKPLDFLPHEVRAEIERTAGVPPADPGEGTKWGHKGFTEFTSRGVAGRRLVAQIAGGCLAFLCVAYPFGVYFLERRAAGGLLSVAPLAMLRSATFLLAVFVVLPQLRLEFNREGWPEVVILLDTSASMAKVDDFKDKEVRAKAEELAGATNLSEVHRLQLAQMLLTRKDADWLDKLLHEKQVKIHIYAVDVQTRMLATVEEDAQAPEGRDAISKLTPNGEGSHLGEGVDAVLKAFRGRSLAGIIMFTDGVTTAGEDLPKIARTASYDGVPLFLVGVGDTWETPDLALTDLQVEDVVGRGDRLVFEARLTARGEVPAAPTIVSLREKVNGKLEDRGQAIVTPDRTGNPVTVTITHTPMEAGEKTFVLVVPSVPGEVNKRNNEIERTVLVTDSRRISVLYVEGYSRYDFRFVKSMLERESDKSLGGKSVEVTVVLLDASNGWAKTDKSAYRSDKPRDFPTRTELFGYDVVILGDVDPRQVGGDRSAAVLRDLADFVKEKGGGLLFLSGEHGTPAAYADTPLAEILPVIPSDAPLATRPPEEDPILEGFQPRLTPAGRMHPLFRFSADEAESMRIWSQLKPLYWYAKNYRRKPLSNVLAVHPTRLAEGGTPGEYHPLVIQQFAGAGPVLFFGFDDTWRWRFRTNEEHFDRFWMQTIRMLSRSRIRRPEVRLSKSEYRRDEKVTVRVVFPIEAPAPAGETSVRVAVKRSPLPNPDGTPGPGQTDTATLVLNRIPGPTVQFETTLARAVDGEYRFELIDPEIPGTRPWATARVLPPMTERERTEMNRSDLMAAAAESGGKFYTLANATDVFNDLKNLQPVKLNQPCPPISLWNHESILKLIFVLLLSEWILRRRVRLL